MSVPSTANAAFHVPRRLTSGSTALSIGPSSGGAACGERLPLPLCCLTPSSASRPFPSFQRIGVHYGKAAVFMLALGEVGFEPTWGHPRQILSRLTPAA